MAAFASTSTTDATWVILGCCPMIGLSFLRYLAYCHAILSPAAEVEDPSESSVSSGREVVAALELELLRCDRFIGSEDTIALASMSSNTTTTK